MFKEIKIEDFYEENTELGAVTIITPKQRITTMNLPVKKANYLVYGIGGHDLTRDLLTCKILGREEASLITEELKKSNEIDEILKNNFSDGVVHKKFITIFHFTKNALINLPNIITPYEYEELKEINEILKKYNVFIECSICKNYDIINDKHIDDEPYEFFSGSNALNDTLKYFNDNNKIQEYDLFDEVIISKYKKRI